MRRREAETRRKQGDETSRQVSNDATIARPSARRPVAHDYVSKSRFLT